MTSPLARAVRLLLDSAGFAAFWLLCAWLLTVTPN